MIYLKQPGEEKAYAADFGLYLADGQSLVSSTATVTPSGLGVAGTRIDTDVVHVTLYGGKAGVIYRVEIAVGVDNGDDEVQEILVRVA